MLHRKPKEEETEGRGNTMEDSGEQKYVHCYEFPWSVHPRLFDDDCQELTGYKIVKIGYGNENRLGVNAADIERIQLQARAPAFSIVPQPGTPHPAQLIFLLRVIPRDNETCEQSAVHFDNFFRETLRRDEVEQNLGQTDIPAPKILLQPYMPRQSEDMGHGKLCLVHKDTLSALREKWIKLHQENNGDVTTTAMAPFIGEYARREGEYRMYHWMFRCRITSKRVHIEGSTGSSDANSDLSISQVTKLVDKLNLSGQGDENVKKEGIQTEQSEGNGGGGGGGSRRPPTLAGKGSTHHDATAPGEDEAKK